MNRTTARKTLWVQLQLNCLEGKWKLELVIPLSLLLLLWILRAFKWRKKGCLGGNSVISACLPCSWIEVSSDASVSYGDVSTNSFDICGTTLMNVGLLYTPVSIYQMTRSALVLFVGFFSVIYLNRKLSKAQFAALGLVTLGVFIVGMSGMFKPDQQPEVGSQAEKEASQVLLGIALILFAQVLFVPFYASCLWAYVNIARLDSTASQFVIEEKIMTRYSVEPLVGGLVHLSESYLISILRCCPTAGCRFGRHFRTSHNSIDHGRCFHLCR